MSKIQRIILPRNWLFGRLIYICNNLDNMIKNNNLNFTTREYEDLLTARRKIRSVISKKKQESEKLKTIWKRNEKGKT